MSDLLTATQDATFAALDVAAVTDLGTVVQHVPEDPPLPLVVIGNIKADDEGTKDGTLERHSFEIFYIYRGEARRHLFALMQAGRDAITGADFEVAGVIFGDARWVSSETDIEDDGVTYLGSQTYEILVQPDDD